MTQLIDPKLKANANISNLTELHLVSKKNVRDMFDTPMIIQGIVTAPAATNLGYISNVSTVSGEANGAVFTSKSRLTGLPNVNTTDWQDVLSITVPTHAKKTMIECTHFSGNASLPTDEDMGIGSIIIDWENDKIYGHYLYNAGIGLAYSRGWYWNEASISADVAVYEGTPINGSYDVSGINPSFQINKTIPNNLINTLPKHSEAQSLTYKVTHLY